MDSNDKNNENMKGKIELKNHENGSKYDDEVSQGVKKTFSLHRAVIRIFLGFIA